MLNLNNSIDQSKNHDEIEENLDKYYDIPIKDFKRNSQYSRDSHSNLLNTLKKANSNIKNEENHIEEIIENNVDSKKNIINEILKDDTTRFLNESMHRPFTPPFSSLPIDGNFMTGTTATANSNSATNDNKIKMLLMPKETSDLELVYDTVLGCYYDAQTNNYYEKR